jgi:two-component system nitrate/nitrite response regulator NarL
MPGRSVLTARQYARGVASNRARTRVVIADDHPLYREGIMRALGVRPDMAIVGAATDGREALALIRELEPDVALLDVRLPSLEGPQILAALKLDGSATRVLFLSAHADGEVVYEAMSAGASGYLSKEATRDEIGDAVARVARGDIALAPELQAGLVGALQLRRGQARPNLTPREREVLAFTAEGLSGPAIAAQLHLSPTTVKTHLQSLYEKLGVSDRAAAVAVALRRGLLD